MASDFKKQTDADLVKELETRKADLQKVRFTFSHGGNKDTKKQSRLRKEISQILNEMRARALKK